MDRAGFQHWHPNSYSPHFQVSPFHNHWQPLPQDPDIPWPTPNMPPNWGQAIEPAGISQSFKARPFGDHNQQWHPAFNHRRRHRAPLPVEWGQPMEPALMPDPQQPAAMLHHDISPWGQLIERPSPQLNGFQGNENFNVHDAFPGAVVPHNGNIWPWAMDHGNFADAADLARRQSSMRRPPKVKPWRRPSRLLRQFALAPRPTDWRPDYPVRPTGLLRRISRLTGSRSPRSAAASYTLNTLLLYDNPDIYPVSYDVRLKPESTEITFMNLNRSSNSLDFCQLATTPPVDELCLWHPRLPWYIRIQALQWNGVTIQDVLCQMHDQLLEPIMSNHFWNVEVSAQDREELTNAFNLRCDGDWQCRAKGAAKVDFLRSDCIFLGLKKSRDGMWEMKTGEATE